MDKGISQTSNLSVSQRDYLQKLKVALATVIIRTKPPDLSSREFAAKLSLQLKKGEESWKEKAKKLEEELLQTKQELLLAELRPKENAVSNHETKDDTFALSFEGMDEDEFHTVLTPPNSSEFHSQQIQRRDVILSNTKFLTSLTKLESIVSPDSDGKFFSTNAIEVIKHSVQIIVTHYKQCLEFDNLPIVTRSSTAIVGLLSSSVLDNHREEVADECRHFIKHVTKNLISKRLRRRTLSGSAVEFIATLGKSPHLRASTLELLTEELLHVSEELRSSVIQQTIPNPWVSENALFLLQVLESILTFEGMKDDTLDHVIMKRVQENLENATLHLNDVLPLFTQYVWKLLGVIEFNSLSM
ncbi:putative meiosis-specific protein MEI4-like [Apostichopus japonicus]|uniref:Putative meiosis-specific protein MEI4-like n=1 Tax=Stichopus japonicus TaxID=307972 RepID=A0A2G8JVY9_STIJA|nr:putative meiosis-specific protein MEI4-like [Apostichopus japonicus]